MKRVWLAIAVVAALVYLVVVPDEGCDTDTSCGCVEDCLGE